MDLSFYKGRTVLVTGHTGFKGSWLCKALKMLGADVVGYALAPPTTPSLFELLKLDSEIKSVYGDIRDLTSLCDTVKRYRPEIIIHMAAQAIVQIGYSEPADTYATNVMGTVNVCEAIRKSDSVRSFLNVTTDKVYRNDCRTTAYTENDVLNGLDPYSNSKSCSELVTASYKTSFLEKMGVAVSTVRAGNVIGGGDFAENRIIPSCIRLASEGTPITVRNPHSVRPYQHVLEAIFAYLTVAKDQYFDINIAGSYNVGPSDADCLETSALTELFCREWGEGASWSYIPDPNAPKEAEYLRLDCSLFKQTFNWSPKWNAGTAIKKTVELSKAIFNDQNFTELMEAQIKEYLN